MGHASRQNEADSQRTVLMICPTDEVQNDFNDFAKRTAALLDSTKTFIEKACELDSDLETLKQVKILTK